MARKYVRDNRGRFASVGATARGGRLKTAAGNKRKRVTASPGAADRMTGVPKGTIGKTRKVRELTMIDRPQDKRVAYNRGVASQKAAIAARKAAPQGPVAGSYAASKIEMAKGRVSVLSKQKDSLNKQLKEVNAQIKEAGPMGGAYRLKKIEIKSRLSETQVALSQAKAAAKPAVNHDPKASKPGFKQADFLRRSARTASIRSPQVKAKAQGLYGRILNTDATPKQLERAFRTTSKYSTIKNPRGSTPKRRASDRAHRDMLAASRYLFK